ncbi:MAG: ABC transporter permease [Bryobacteraceae bacterium]|jgi:predicted permease
MLRHDVTLAFRRLRSSPGFTAAAIVTLALGIGANTTMFSLVDAVVFRPFGVRNQSELIFFNHHTSTGGEGPMMSYPDYKDYRDRNTVLSGLAMFDFEPFNMSRGGARNNRLWGFAVSGNYFDMLGVQPFLGRLLHPADDVNRGGHPVVVLAWSCWQADFGGDPNVVGKRVRIDGLDYTIVGVAPRAFTGTEVIITPQVYVPLAMSVPAGPSWMDDRSSLQGWVIGRLKPGVSMKSAEAAINTIAAALRREYPKDDAGVSIVLSPPGMGGTFLRPGIIGFSAVGMVVAGLVLLIACVNLAGLLLARAADRRKEVAIRLALGASQGQLLRQLLTESLLLSIAGGAAGVLLASWLTALVNAWRPPIDTLTMTRVAIDTRVLLFAAAVSLLSVFLFGLVPALQSARTNLAGAMKNHPSANRLPRLTARDLLVTVQVALSVVLVIGSILVVRSLHRALSLNLGFQPEHAAVLSFDLGGEGYDEQRGRGFQRRVLDRVRAMPGIQAAGMSSGLPLYATSDAADAIYLEGKPEPRPGDVPHGFLYAITPGYLQAMHTRLVAGRDLDRRDKKEATPAALVNKEFVRRLLPGEDPSGVIGRRFRHDPAGKWIQIVGVVEDGKYYTLAESPELAIFEPIEQRWSQAQTLVARSPMAEAETVRQLRRAVLELDPTLTVFEEGSLTHALGLALFPARMAAAVLGSFGALALVLASTGVYGIMAYAVARRTREIGIRMALGAAPSQVARAVLRRTAIMLAAGVAIGMVLAFAGGTFFSQILYRISAHDPLTYLYAIALMALVAFIATWVPARRAIKVDPLTALRME